MLRCIYSWICIYSFSAIILLNKRTYDLKIRTLISWACEYNFNTGPCWFHSGTRKGTKATCCFSWLVYKADIQMPMAWDIWWFSNLSSCHQEMGRAHLCHHRSASQTAPRLHLNLPCSLSLSTIVSSSTCSPNVSANAPQLYPLTSSRVGLTLLSHCL